MPCVAQFGIIDELDKKKDYGIYEPEKYNCVAINDDIISDWWVSLLQMKSYFHCYERPDFALARWGVTLIPPESLSVFYNIVVSDRKYKPHLINKNIKRCEVYNKLTKCKKYNFKLHRKYAKYFLARDLFFLAKQILVAINRNKYMIHFGV